MSGQKIYGMLTTQWVKLPYKTPEEQAEADKANRDLAAAGLSVQVFHGATDFAFRKYEDALPPRGRKKEAAPEKPLSLKSGDLVKVFNTVSDGDVLWQGAVDYSYRKYHHGLQKRMKPQKWAGMFNAQLPARLERDGKTAFGMLEPFAETGTEGIIWSLFEYGKSGYDGLNYLKKGDKLTVYSRVRDGTVEWEGALDFKPEKVTKIGWTEVMRETAHMDTQKWLQMSWQNRPAILTPKP